MRSKKQIKTWLLVTLFTLLTSSFLSGADSRNFPVIASYCDKTTIPLYPYSLVSPTDGTPFQCTNVEITSITNGLQYRFEDKDDNDYNDLIVDVWISGNLTGNPVTHVRFISKEASYHHWLYLNIDGREQLVFKAEESTPGTVYDIPLPVVVCDRFQGHLKKSFAKANAAPGDEVWLTIEAFNSSREKSQNITIKDTLSPLLKVIYVEAPVTVVQRGQDLKWTLPAIKGKETVLLKIKVRISDQAQPGQVVNIAYLHHNSLTKPMASNRAVLRIGEPGLILTKEVDKQEVEPGGILEYHLIVENLSSITLASVSIDDTLSSHLEFLSQSGDFTFQQQGSQLTWQTKLKKKQKKIITIQVRVKPDTLAGSQILNRAYLKTPVLKRKIESNSVETLVTAQPITLGKVRFTKRSDVPQSDVGRIFRFSMIVSNQSSGRVLSPTIKDYLPQGFSYVPASTLLNGQRFSDPIGKRTMSWQLPVIQSMETVVVQFQVIVGADASRGRNINRATLRGIDNSGQEIFLRASALVHISAGGFIFYSGVEGIVFLDRDGDQIVSAADTPVEGVEVRLSSGEKAITNRDGRYTFLSLFPGEYAIGLNRATLPEKYTPITPFAQPVLLMDGLTDHVDFALKFRGQDEKRPARLKGRVFFDKNQNRIFDPSDTLVQQFKARLDTTTTTIGKDGGFIFSRLAIGKHTIEILYSGKSVKRELTLKRGNNFVDFPLPYSGIKILIKEKGQND